MSNEITTAQQEKVTQNLLVEYVKNNNINLSNQEFGQFCAVATAFNLNPIKREIYAVKYGSTFNVIVGYEVYLKRAEAFPQYDGYETEFGGEGKDTYCKCSVYRKDRTRPTTSTVYMSEYNTGKSLWQSKPRVMLEKVAICTALRRAFPSDFDGMPYTKDEMPEPTQNILEPSKEIKPAPAPAVKKTASAEQKATAKATAKPFSVICNEEEKRIGTEAFNKVLFDFGVVDIKGVYDLGKKKYESFVEELRKLPDYVEEKIVEAEVVGNTDLFDDFA